MVILIGTMYFIPEGVAKYVLVTVTLVLSMGFGWMLVRSVKLEVQRKEELQMMSDKLSSANDQLRKLDNAKSEFISIASHQLRTPLTAIKGFVSLLLEGTYGEINPKAHDALNKVYQANEHLVNLVEDLLNISRIESGRMQYDFKAWQLNDFLTELRDNFLLAAKNKELYLDVKIPNPPLPEVEMDGGKVREVVSNLIDNALKYTKKGGVTVRVEGLDVEGAMSADKAQIQKVRFVIADTGIGIPETEMPYIFSKFSRGKDTSRLSATGTGLGLYVGRAMIEAHQGRIWAESKGDGHGSKFFIELPVKHAV
jgi:signal transduction histidine kinase